MRFAPIVPAATALALLITLCGCAATSDSEPVTDQAKMTNGPSSVWQCVDEFQAMVSTGDEEITLTMPMGQVVLPHVPSASGAQYSNGEVTFWNKGEESTVEEGGNVHPGCREIGSSVQEGAEVFRALGNEPGWLMDITDGDRITLISHYGDTYVSGPAPEPTMNGDVKSYLVERDGHQLSIEMRPELCQDSMSGFPFPWTVSVALDDRAFEGCGFFPAPQAQPPAEQ